MSDARRTWMRRHRELRELRKGLSEFWPHPGIPTERAALQVYEMLRDDIRALEAVVSPNCSPFQDPRQAHSKTSAAAERGYEPRL